MTAVNWKLTIAWEAGARKKAGGVKGHRSRRKTERFRLMWCGIVERQMAPPSGYAVPRIRTFSHRARDRTGARLAGGVSPSIHTKGGRFPQPLASGLKFRQQQFADIGAVDATSIRVARLAQRSSYGLLRSCLRHDQL